jgi:hypothetical protein
MEAIRHLDQFSEVIRTSSSARSAGVKAEGISPSRYTQEQTAFPEKRRMEKALGGESSP